MKVVIKGGTGLDRFTEGATTIMSSILHVQEGDHFHRPTFSYLSAKRKRGGGHSGSALSSIYTNKKVGGG